MSFTLPAIQKTATTLLENTGLVFINLSACIRHVWKREVDWRKAMTQIAMVGFDSLGMSILICTIAGSVLALQTATRFAQSGALSYVGGLVSLAVVREIGPIFTCLAVGARSGTAIAAEIANMKVNEQIDALRTLKISPVRYLMLPRLIGCILSLPMLTMIGMVSAIIGGMAVSQTVTGLHFTQFLDSCWLSLKPYDIRVGLFKSVIFGITLAAISCTIGLNTRGGAKDVGLATIRAVVWTSISIIILDFLLTWAFFGHSEDI